MKCLDVLGDDCMRFFSLAGEWSFFPWLACNVRRHPDSSAVFVAGGPGALCGHPLPPERRYGSLQAPAFPQPPTIQTLSHCLPHSWKCKGFVFHSSIRDFRETSVLTAFCLMSPHFTLGTSIFSHASVSWSQRAVSAAHSRSLSVSDWLTAHGAIQGGSERLNDAVEKCCIFIFIERAWHAVGTHTLI